MLMIIFSLALVASIQAASPWDTLTANIAVVEYAPIFNSSFNDTQNIDLNVQHYTEIIQTVTNQKKLDMIVFPEGTLGPATSTEIAVGDNPCTEQKQYPQFMMDLSCTAMTFTTYLVTNIIEKVKCDNGTSGDSPNCLNYGGYCTTLTWFLIETAQLSPVQSFGEYQLDRPAQPEVVTFETDFGIKFGIFTCFDILFKSPAEDVLAEDIDAIVYPTNWVSELPFLTALQSQEMFSYAHETVFFSAGYNAPLYSAGGTGVHRGASDTVLQTIVASGGSQVLLFESVDGVVTPVETQDVDLLGKEMDAFTMLVDNSLPNFTWVPLNTSQIHTEEQICHGSDSENAFCCTFNVSLTNSDEDGTSYSYLLTAFSGLRHYPGIADGGFEICAIIACLNSSISSCGQRFPRYEEIVWPVTFDEVTIRANFEVSDNKTQFPNSLLSSIRPIDASQTEWSGKEVEIDGKNMIKRTFSIKESQNRLFTFAIYGRDFGQDVFPRDQNEKTMGFNGDIWTRKRFDSQAWL